MVSGAAALAGNLQVGPSCYLGTHCSIHPGVRIGEGSLLGMGSVVRRDIDPHQVAVGNPAQVLRDARQPEPD